MSEGGTTIGDLQPESGGAGGRGARGFLDGGLWRIPALALGGALLAGGVFSAVANRPEPDHRPALQLAARQINGESYREAIDTLNTRVFPYLANGKLPEELAGEFHALLARALAGGQSELEVRAEQNDRNVIAQYLEAERLGVLLTPEDQAKMADAFVAMGRYEDAERRIALIPKTEPALRDRLVRRLVDQKLSIAQPRLIEALEYLGRLLSEPGLREEQKLWALARQAEVRLELGFADETINQLLRELPLLQRADPEAVAELYLWLGRAYFELDALDQAEQQLARADRDGGLPPGDGRRAMARLYRAHVLARSARDDLGLERARDAYAALVESAGGTDAYLPALLGLGELEAAMGQPRSSIEAFGALVEEIELRRRTFEEISVAPGTVAQSLIDRFHERSGAGDSSTALEYATLAGELFPLADAPPFVLESLGAAHAGRADDLLGDRAEGIRLRDLTELDPGMLQQVKRHLIQAASFYRAHADRFILDDYAVYADSLWRSAGLYDRAGDTRATVAALTEFTEAVREDPRRAEGRFVLAQAHQALGQYDTAAALYRALIADRARDARDGVGVWADRSHVPLAQSLLLDGDTANDAEAEGMLFAALDGRRGGPDRPEYRDALFELGRVFDRSGRHDLAIERLTELLERAPEDPRALSTKYRLADGYRKLAGQIERQIGETLRQSQVRTLQSQRREHLARAIRYFEEVRDGLGAKPAAVRTALEDVHLRNAHFYLGDCAFDLGEYERAIAYYSASRNRYPRDPAVLVALIQIVNSYVEMGDLLSARTANERARDFYASLPDDVWNDPDLPMGRRDWERWLESSARLYDDLAQAD